jgi:hypothetical protein
MILTSWSMLHGERRQHFQRRERRRKKEKDALVLAVKERILAKNHRTESAPNRPD